MAMVVFDFPVSDKMMDKAALAYCIAAFVIPAIAFLITATIAARGSLKKMSHMPGSLDEMDAKEKERNIDLEAIGAGVGDPPAKRCFNIYIKGYRLRFYYEIYELVFAAFFLTVVAVGMFLLLAPDAFMRFFNFISKLFL